MVHNLFKLLFPRQLHQYQQDLLQQWQRDLEESKKIEPLMVPRKYSLDELALQDEHIASFKSYNWPQVAAMLQLIKAHVNFTKKTNPQDALAELAIGLQKLVLPKPKSEAEMMKNEAEQAQRNAENLKRAALR